MKFDLTNLLKKLNFQARHHLAAATQVLLEHQKNMLKSGMTDDEKKATEETFNHRLADVNRCWVKYALNLMSDSRDRLLRDSEEPGKKIVSFYMKNCWHSIV